MHVEGTPGDGREEVQYTEDQLAESLISHSFIQDGLNNMFSLGAAKKPKSPNRMEQLNECKSIQERKRGATSACVYISLSA